MASSTTATIYHFGYSQSKDVFLGYAYRSTNNWQSESIQYGVGIKPVVAYDLGTSFELPKSFIKLMEYQREEDLKLPISQRLGIGGEIHFINMNKNGIFIQMCHKFSSYEDDYNIMCERISKHNLRLYSDAR